MKKTWGVLALACLALASCTPGLMSRDRATLTAMWAAVSVLSFGAGLSDVLDFKFTINGSDLRVNSPQFCRVDQGAILCTVPRLPAGKNFVLPMRGSNISAVATYKRLSGQSYLSETRQ